jgi:flagellar basal-body rod modification protein FlgD
MNVSIPSSVLDSVNAANPSLVDPTLAKKPTSVNQQEFLTLFVAQLQNQDPLSPLQPDQLTAQLAQFSSLEQLTGINSRLDTLTGATTQATTASLLGLIGKEIRHDSSDVAVKEGQAPAATYTLTDAADQVTATISNADGTVVRTIELGPAAAGEQTFQFDGRDAAGGVVPDGTYHIEISARPKGASEATPVSLVTWGLVDGVDLAGDPPALLVGGERVTLDRIQQVRDPATATDSTTDSTPNSGTTAKP